MWFQGHYAEPIASIVLPLKDLKERLYALEYNPMSVREKKAWDKIVPLTK